MPQANPIAKKKLAAQAAYKEAVTAKAKQKKGNVSIWANLKYFKTFI